MKPIVLVSIIEFDSERNMHVYAPMGVQVSAINGETFGVTLHTSEVHDGFSSAHNNSMNLYFALNIISVFILYLKKYVILKNLFS